jgi:hypothetical protein
MNVPIRLLPDKHRNSKEFLIHHQGIIFPQDGISHSSSGVAFVRSSRTLHGIYDAAPCI